mmetsp:Transcript_2307/g.5361  ORF Transcript_2307/g.5361 Transcript_2307/m.5361 type:complete len:116 (-) Transcript_2307:157-504(-)
MRPVDCLLNFYTRHKTNSFISSLGGRCAKNIQVQHEFDKCKLLRQKHSDNSVDNRASKQLQDIMAGKAKKVIPIGSFSGFFFQPIHTSSILGGSFCLKSAGRNVFQANPTRSQCS